MLHDIRNYLNKLLYIISIIILFTVGCEKNTFNPLKYESYPWPTSSPEDQGLDSSILREASVAAKNKGYVNSLLVFRNGYVVMEKYYNGYRQGHPHLVQSVSKSFLSAMIGIAFREGYLDSLDQRIIEFFPEVDTPSLDWRKRNITIRHLLTMRAGFDSDHAVFFQVYNSSDWVRNTWNLSLVNNPNERFVYNTFETHLLSVILTRATGMTSYQFAHAYLLRPLDIWCHSWEQDPQGYYFGGAGMYFTPRDMARLGYLYLRGGSLSGQIVPQDWVEQSLKDYVRAQNWEWGALKELGYGFLWWLGEIGGYEVFTALGHGGQFILCFPELDMVVVSTCYSEVDWDTADAQERSILDIVAAHILPAVIE